MDTYEQKPELSGDIKRALDNVSHLLIMLNYKEMARNYKQAIEKLISMLPQKKEDLPKWRRWYNGACGNGNNIPIALVKVGCSYALTDCLGIIGQEYIMLSDLEKLPKEDEK